MKVIVDSKDGEKAGSGALLNARGVFHTCFFALALGAQSGFSRVMKVSLRSAAIAKYTCQVRSYLPTSPLATE